MNNNWSKIIIKRTIRQFLQQDKRFKGHAKWQNIMHTKQLKDSEKSQLFLSFSKRMKIAIAEGKSSKPSDNLRLASIIEEAKKKNMPAATITNVLEKAEKSKGSHQSDLIEFRGPANSLFLLRIVTDNIKAFRQSMNTFFRKNGCRNDSCLNAFVHQGFVITEVKSDLDSATMDAINVGAEDVHEFEEKDGKFFRFICDPRTVPKVNNQLSTLNYKILTADEEYFAKTVMDLNDDDMKRIDTLCEKLEKIDEVMAIYHNVNVKEEEEKEEQSSSS